jgi:hypothetical protein
MKEVNKGMTAQMTIETNFKTKAEAEAELLSVRENCHTWAMDDHIQNMREYLARTGLSLTDIGTSEEELESCCRAGLKSSVQNWLEVAKGCCNYRDVSLEIGQVRICLAETNLRVSDIGSSEGELNGLLLAHRRARKSALPLPRCPGDS